MIQGRKKFWRCVQVIYNHCVTILYKFLISGSTTFDGLLQSPKPFGKLRPGAGYALSGPV